MLITKFYIPLVSDPTSPRDKESTEEVTGQEVGERVRENMGK